MKARLEHKLIVPANSVSLDVLNNFVVSVKNADGEMVDYAYHYLDYENNLYYFDRGDLGLIYRVFPHLEIEDRRSAPMMRCSSIQTSKGLGLVFTGQLRENQLPVLEALSNGLGYGQLKAHPRFGKTVVMTALACKLGLRTLLLSHQIDLSKQALDKFKSYTNMDELESITGNKIVGIVEDWDDMLNYDVCIMPYQKFVSGNNKEKWLLRLRNEFGLVLVDECFHFFTKVLLHDGRKEYIGTIVNNIESGKKIDYLVRSWNNETNQWENKPVTGYSKSLAVEDWYVISFGKNSQIKCTGNHGWYLDNYTKVKAEDLKIGDTVMVFPDNYRESYSLAKITSISRCKVKRNNRYKFNIEVKDNHNYVVGSGYLVSNCHRVKAETYAYTLSSFNSKYRYGVSGTTELKNNAHLLAYHVLGPVVVEGHGDQLPFSVITYNTGISVPIRPGKLFFTMSLTYLAGNEKRNQFILSVVKPWLEAGHSIMITSERTNHCDFLTNEIKKMGFTAESYHAKRFKNKDQREAMLERMRTGETQAMVAMRSMVLGLDIPRLTAFFNALPTAHPENYFQEFSRVRTPYEQLDENGVVIAKKEIGWVIDFRDNHHILKACYKTRRRKYLEEKALSVQDDLSDEDKTPNYGNNRF